MNDAPYDLEKIKREAKESIRDGAVTKDYPLDIHKACELLNEALATEIMCVLRYRHHAVSAKGIDNKEVKSEFIEHAEEEAEHMLMLAERINQLGGDPNFDPKFVVEKSTTEYGHATTLIDMIKDDLVAERIAIMVYRKLIEWFGEKDPTTRIMLEKILEQEENHANDLADMLYNDGPVKELVES